MNRWSRDELIGTVFHELAHQKLYLKGDTAFNESFATFVQHEGLREWHAAQGTPLEQPAEAAHEKAITQLILRTRKRLASLYASTASEAQKRAGKARAFDDMRQQFQTLKKQWHGKDAGFTAWMAAPMNNAKLLPFGLYDHWEPAFAELFRRQYHDWPAFYRAVKALSRQPGQGTQGADAGAIERLHPPNSTHAKRSVSLIVGRYQIHRIHVLAESNRTDP